MPSLPMPSQPELALDSLVILGASIVFIVVAIARWRLHAFFALLLAALLVALASGLTGPSSADLAGMVEKVMTELGIAAGKIALPIALAAVIGVCLTESGAADKLVRRLVALCGEKRADVALLASGFVLSIPVFFDTVFFLLVPLARTLARRTGGNYLRYLLAICAGGVLTHSLVPPTPGPLLVAEMLRLELGHAMIGGLLAGIVPAVASLWIVHVLNRRNPIAPPTASAADIAWADRPESQLPGLGFSLLPILLPLVLIGGASFVLLARPAGHTSAAWTALAFLGNKHVAMLAGTACAVALLARQRREPLARLAPSLASPLETAGVIILITSAGGAYGAMIKHARVGDSISALAENYQLNYVFLAWALTALIRVAQGSATVAMITATGIMQSIGGAGGWGTSPVYIYLAIGYGSFFLSWMNDSGFWVVGRMGGLTEGQTLRTWSVLLTLLSIIGLVQVLIVSALFPLS
jgi:gluconate:H+ symporter, GntP family